MVAYKTEAGYTVVEMVITLVVLALFLTLFFQIFLLSESQRISVTRLAVANDLAQTNLRKITTKAQAQPLIKAPVIGCETSNDLTVSPNAAGSDLTFTSEPVMSPLPPDPQTKQYLRIVYPQGCNPLVPAQIISTVTYGTETVTRASYIN